MQLGEWMEAAGLDDAALGERLGERDPRNRKSRVTVSRYRRGIEPIPSPIVKELVEISGGQMTADELLGIELPAPTEAETPA